jgi:hypothetical protein
VVIVNACVVKNFMRTMGTGNRLTRTGDENGGRWDDLSSLSVIVAVIVHRSGTREE